MGRVKRGRRWIRGRVESDRGWDVRYGDDFTTTI